MTDQSAIDVLNELRLAELAGLLPRLAESMIFVAPQLASEYAELQRMIEQETGHVRLLEETILDLGGNLVPGSGDLASANLHYVGLPVLLPRLLDDQRCLADACEAATPQVASCPPAAAAVSQLGAQHREHAERLGQLAERCRSGAT